MSGMNNVTYRRQEYDKALPGWTRTRAAIEGEEAVKALPNVLPYINPQDESPENIQRNRDYLTRAVYFNAAGRTLDGLVGLAFAKDPSVNLGPFTYLEDDANGEGVSIYHAAQHAMAGVLATGRHGILADYVNGRPAIIGYDAESIINWRVADIDGMRKLVLLVLHEVVSEAGKDGYSIEDVNQYREYRLEGGRVTLRIWREGKDETVGLYDAPELSLPSSVTPYLTEIPFAFVGSESNSSKIQPAPLRGLAEMNFAHFRDSADYQDSVFYCGQVQPWASGLTEEWRDKLKEDGFYMGSRAVLLLPVGGEFGFSQAQPNTLAHEAMNDKKDNMVALGARVVEQNQITKTATQAAGDIATGTSVLGLVSANVSEAMTLSLQRLGYFKSAKPFMSAKFEITKDFTELSMDPQKVIAVVQTWQSGLLAKKDARDYYKKIGLVAPERTDAEIDEEIAADPLFSNPPVGDKPTIRGPV